MNSMNGIQGEHNPEVKTKVMYSVDNSPKHCLQSQPNNSLYGTKWNIVVISFLLMWRYPAIKHVIMHIAARMLTSAFRATTIIYNNT